MAEGGLPPQQQPCDEDQVDDADLFADATAEQPESMRSTLPSSCESHKYPASNISQDYHSKCPKEKGCQHYLNDVIIFYHEKDRVAAFEVKKWIDDNVAAFHGGREYRLKTVLMPDVHTAPVFEAFEKACGNAKNIVVIVTKNSVENKTMNLMNYILWAEKAKTGVELTPILVGYDAEEEAPNDFTVQNAFFIRFLPKEDYFKYRMQRLAKFIQTRLHHDEIRLMCARENYPNVETSGSCHAENITTSDCLKQNNDTCNYFSCEQEQTATIEKKGALASGLGLPGFMEQDGQTEDRKTAEDFDGPGDDTSGSTPTTEMITASEDAMPGIAKLTAQQTTAASADNPGKTYCVPASSSPPIDSSEKLPDSGLGESNIVSKEPSSTAIIESREKLESRVVEDIVGKVQGHSFEGEHGESNQGYSELNAGFNAHSGLNQMEITGRIGNGREANMGLLQKMADTDSPNSEQTNGCSTDIVAPITATGKNNDNIHAQETLEGEKRMNKMEPHKEEKAATTTQSINDVGPVESNAHVSHTSDKPQSLQEDSEAYFDAQEHHYEACTLPAEQTTKAEESKSGKPGINTKPTSTTHNDQTQSDMAMDSEIYHGDSSNLTETSEHPKEDVEGNFLQAEQQKRIEISRACDNDSGIENSVNRPLDSITDLKTHFQSGTTNEECVPCGLNDEAVCAEAQSATASSFDPNKMSSTDVNTALVEGVMPDTQTVGDNAEDTDWSITDEKIPHGKSSADCRTEKQKQAFDVDLKDEGINSKETELKKTAHHPDLEKMPVQETFNLEATQRSDDEGGETKRIESASRTTMHLDKQSPTGKLTKMFGDHDEVLQQQQEKQTAAGHTKMDLAQRGQAEAVPFHNNNEVDRRLEDPSSATLAETDNIQPAQGNVTANANVKHMNPVIHVHTTGTFVFTNNYTVNHEHEETFNTHTSNSRKLMNNITYNGSVQGQDSNQTQSQQRPSETDVQNSQAPNYTRREDASTSRKEVVCESEAEDGRKTKGDAGTSWWSILQCTIL